MATLGGFMLVMFRRDTRHNDTATGSGTTGDKGERKKG
jgi:hypothetical protein